MNSAEMADHFINRAKQLQEFVVTTEIPEDFRFNGLIPFDIQIKDDTIYATVYAISFDEAATRLNDFLDTCK